MKNATAWLTLAFQAAFLTSLFWPGMVYPAAAAEERPNILLILADDLGWSDLGCYGGEIKTPTLDRLAAGGLRFTQFYNSAKCEPTRACLMSGLYWQDAGLGIKRGITMGQAMRAAGYATFAVGKWHLDGNPFERGFDHYFGHLSGASDYFKGNPSHRLDAEPYTPPDNKFYTTDANADFAIKFIEESKRKNPEKPFFMYLAFNAPHAPLQAWPEDIARYRGQYKAGWDKIRQERYQRQIRMGLIRQEWALSPRPAAIPAWDALKEKEKDFEDLRMAIFAAMVDRMDQAVGRVLNKINDLGIADNTLVMFLSDNGGSPYDRGRSGTLPNPDAHWEYGLGWANTSVTPWRHYKRNMYNGGACTPFIASWPAKIKQAGVITDERAHIIDLMATLVDLAGWQWPGVFEGKPLAPLPGKSLVPLFAGNTRQPHEVLYFHLMDHRAVMSGNWKLASDWGRPWELFDVNKDRTELHDLARQQPEEFKRLEVLWNRWWEGKDASKLRAAGAEPAYRHLDDPREATQGGNDEPDQTGQVKKAGRKKKNAAAAVPVTNAPLAGPVSFNHTFKENAGEWKAEKELAPFTFADGALVTRATGANPGFILSPCQVNGSKNARLQIRLAVSEGGAKSLKLWWTAVNLPRFSDPKSLTLPIKADGQMHDYGFDVGKEERWQGKTITALKLEFAGGKTGAEIKLQSVQGVP